MTATHFTPTALTPDEHSAQLRRAVIAAPIGTAIEWYDFFLYSTVTGLVFAKLFFPEFRSAGRHAGGLRHLCRRLRRAAGRRRDLRPLRRPHRPQVDADRHPDAHGHRDLPGRARADLREHRHLGRRHPDRPALHPGRRRRRRMGRLGAAVDGVGAHQPASRLHRVVAAVRRARAACSLPISRCWPSAQMSGEQFLAWGWRVPFFLSIILVARRPLHPARHSRDAGLRQARRRAARSSARRCSK